MNNQWIHITATPSGGPGFSGPPTPEDGEVTLTVYQPIYDNISLWGSPPPQVFVCTWEGNFIEGGSGIRYAEWKLTQDASDVVIRFYDDVRAWWWDVPEALQTVHPLGTQGSQLGVEDTSGFTGSEDDGDCDPSMNEPFQLADSVLNFNDSGALLSCSGSEGDSESNPGGDTDFDPNFCSCGATPIQVCLMVTLLDWTKAGTVVITAPPTSMGVRKYTYHCLVEP